jgi:NAD(P)-dependent dehydrogenase (short-subunit alcohol dehydrogenase family)
MHSREQSGFVVRYTVRKAIAAYSAPTPVVNISQKGPARSSHSGYRVPPEVSGFYWRSRDGGDSSGGGPAAPLGRARELAAAALLLTDPQSAYIPGTVLPVDGGWTSH